MRISLKNILFLSLILLFFPAFCIWISIKPIVIYFIVVILAYILLILLKPLKFFSKLRFLYKYSPFKYYIFFAIWCILSGCLLIALGKYSLNTFLYYTITLLLVAYAMTYLLPFLIFDNKKFNLIFFARLLLLIYFIIFIIGFLEFIGKTFHYDILTFPSVFLGNQRLLNNTSIIDGSYNRIRSIFAEPGWLGGFIFFNMPILYSLSLSKFKIFNTNFLNLIIKKSLIPMMWITIIIAQSAIWLVFNFILTIYYFRKNIYYFIIKHYKILFIIIFSFSFIITKIINSGLFIDLGFYNRIFLFLSNINNFDQLVLADQSLGCRLVSYIITFKIGLKNYLLGVGLGNTYYIFPFYYSASSLPYVGELASHYNEYISSSSFKMNFNSAIPFHIFAETGILGITLFYVILLKTIASLNKIRKYFYNLEYDFLTGLYHTCCVIPIIIFYDIPIAYYYIWFLLGLTNIFIYSYKKRIRFK